MVIDRRRLVALLGLAPVLLGGQQSEEDRIWNDFLDWLRQTPDPTLMPVAAYRRKLADDGVSLARLAEYEGILQSRMLTRTEGMRLWYNRIYTTREGVFSARPNAFLMQATAGLTAGAALDVGMGQGRNAIFLAQQGWQVTGFDVADEGLRIARENAKRADVTIRTVHAGYQNFDFGRSRWDLIVMTYAFVPVTKPEFVNRVIESLRPGGVLAFEHFVYTGSPWDRPAAGWIGEVASGELPEVFGELEMLHYEETEAMPDWGAPGPAPIVRFLARKARVR